MPERPRMLDVEASIKTWYGGRANAAPDYDHITVKHGMHAIDGARGTAASRCSAFSKACSTVSEPMPGSAADTCVADQ